MIFGVIATVMLVASSLFLLAILRFNSRVSNILAFFTLSAGQIVFLSELLSFASMLSSWGLLLGHFLLMGLSYLIWRMRGSPNLLHSLRPFAGTMWKLPLSPVGLAIVLGLVFLLGFMISRGEIVSYDAVTYHLPRVHYWLNQGNALHFPTDDYRQTQFPPNASFLFLWLIAWTQAYDLAYLVQSLFGIILTVGTIGLARLAGYSRQGSLLAGITTLTAPMIMLQLNTAQSDLITAGFGVGFVYFSVRMLQHKEKQSHWLTNDSLLAGVSLGLFVGTKLTALFLLVPVGVLFLVLACLAGSLWWKKTTALIAVSMIGFLLFGLFNYALNFFEYGNPVASPAAVNYEYSKWEGIYSEQELHTLRDPLENILRYSYQMMDWSLFSDLPLSNIFYRINWQAFDLADDFFASDPEVAPGFDYIEFGMRPLSTSRAGFSLIGYLSLLLSPLFLVLHVLRKREVKFSSRLLRSSYILVAWLWLLIFALLIPWSELKTRYFTMWTPFLFASIIPLVDDLKPDHSFPGIFILLLLFLQSLRVVGIANGLKGTKDFNERQLSIIRSAFVEDARLGVQGDVRFPLILEQLPQLTFVPVVGSDYRSSVEEMGLDGLLIRNNVVEDRRALIPFGARLELYVANPGQFIVQNSDWFFLEVENSSGCSAMTLNNGFWLVRTSEEERWLEFVLPTLPIAGCPEKVQLTIDLGNEFANDRFRSASCDQFERDDTRISNGLIKLTGNPMKDSQKQLFSCRLHYAEGGSPFQNPTGRWPFQVEVSQAADSE